MSRSPYIAAALSAAGWLAAAGLVLAQEPQGPIATHREPHVAAAAAEPVKAEEPDPFAWLRRPTSEEAVRWRAAEDAQAQHWLAADRNYPSLLKEAAAGADDLPVEAAGARVYVKFRDGAAEGDLWRSRLAQGTDGWRREPALDAVAGATSPGAPHVVCDPVAGRLCLLLRRTGAGTAVAGFDPASGEARPDPFQTPAAVESVALEDEADLLAVTKAGDVESVSRLSLGHGPAAVVFRASAGDVVTPGSATAPGSQRVSWLTVRHPDTTTTLMVETQGEFRRLATPPGSEMVGVVGDQLVVELRRGWSEGGYPAGSLLALDLKPVLARAPELTPHAILKLVDAPDIRQVAATRSGLIVVAREGATEVAYLCDPSLRGWAVRRLPPSAARTLEIAASSVTGDVVVLRSRAFPEGDRLSRVDMRSGLIEPVRPQREDFAGRARRTFEASALDRTRIGYTVVEGDAKGVRPVLLLAAPRDAHETAVLRDLGTLWLAHGGDLAIAGPRARRYVAGAGLTEMLVGFEDLSSIARDLAARGASGRGVALAGYRTGASIAAADLVKHPGQWSAAVLIDPVADPLGARTEDDEPWAQMFSDAREPSVRKAWRRISPYDNLRAGTRYAPVLTLQTPEVATAFASDGPRFTARLNAVGGDSLHVDAPTDAQACALSAAFLLRVLGVTPSTGA